jgi:hypothetical protein
LGEAAIVLFAEDFFEGCVFVVAMTVQYMKPRCGYESPFSELYPLHSVVCILHRDALIRIKTWSG